MPPLLGGVLLRGNHLMLQDVTNGEPLLPIREQMVLVVIGLRDQNLDDEPEHLVGDELGVRQVVLLGGGHGSNFLLERG